MSESPQSWRPAWEPFTPRGVAAFGGASFGRLLLAQFIVAVILAVAVIWFLREAWFPVVRSAIHELPAQGEISGQQLDWDGDNSVQLAENPFLGVAVDLYHSGQLGRAAHLQVEFGKDDFRVYSLLGYQVFEYPPNWETAFNKTDLEPWWGAWQPWITVGAAVVTVVAMMFLWLVLATLYFVPVRVMSFLEDRDLNLRQSWLLSGAAMLPGALFFAAGIFAYGLGWMDLIRLGAMCGLQFVIGWIYLFVSPMFCPRAAAATKASANPFAATKESAKPAGTSAETK